MSELKRLWDEKHEELHRAVQLRCRAPNRMEAAERQADVDRLTEEVNDLARKLDAAVRS